VSERERGSVGRIESHGLSLSHTLQISLMHRSAPTREREGTNEHIPSPLHLSLNSTPRRPLTVNHIAPFSAARRCLVHLLSGGAKNAIRSPPVVVVTVERISPLNLMMAEEWCIACASCKSEARFAIRPLRSERSAGLSREKCGSSL
jgi:hypothetical protein